eukprot:scaffold50510_cov54-Phaeocystis_antarctica.AAC.3
MGANSRSVCTNTSVPSTRWLSSPTCRSRASPTAGSRRSMAMSVATSGGTAAPAVALTASAGSSTDPGGSDIGAFSSCKRQLKEEEEFVHVHAHAHGHAHAHDMYGASGSVINTAVEAIPQRAPVWCRRHHTSSTGDLPRRGPTCSTPL